MTNFKFFLNYQNNTFNPNTYSNYMSKNIASSIQGGAETKVAIPLSWQTETAVTLIYNGASVHVFFFFLFFITM